MTTPNPSGTKTGEALWRKLEVAITKVEPHWSYNPENKLPSYGRLHPRRSKAAKQREWLATI